MIDKIFFYVLPFIVAIYYSPLCSYSLRFTVLVNNILILHDLEIRIIPMLING